MLKILCFLLAIHMSTSKTSSPIIEGYPTGYLSDCPGSEKEARISRNSLRKLKLIVYNGPNIIANIGNLTAANYYNVKKLTKYMDFNKKTILCVMGYVDSNYLTPTNIMMGAVYKSLGYNVLALEYLEFSTLAYPKAARLLRPIGKHAAEMLAELTKYGLDPKKLEIMGLSHGGQGISFIAKNFRAITGKNVSRVTSLDPSGPCFRHNDPDERIDASDADFVDIIHTNIDGYGMAGAVGHVDFYINGGEYQLGDFETLPCTTVCSHSRSYTIWVAALLNPDLFIGMQCDSIQDARERNCFDRKPLVTNVIGLKVDKSKQGIFYVMSKNSFPFGMGEKGLYRKNEVFNNLIGKYNSMDVLEL